MPEGKQKPQIRFKGFSDVWELRRFGDSVLIQRGGSPRPIESYLTDDENGINWVKIGDVSVDSRYITKTKEKIISEGEKHSRRVQIGDLILSNSMSFGRPYIMAVEGCIHDGWLLIRDHKNLFDKEYLLQLLSSDYMYSQYKSLASGGVVNNLNSELVQSTISLIPPIEEQQKIGKYFAQLDSLILLHQRKYEKLLTLKKSCIEKMFPKNENKNPEIRFKGFSAPWEEHKLSNVTSMHARIGWQNLRTSEFLDSGNYYLITGTDFIDGKIDLKTCHFVEKERYDQDKNIQIKNGSILITKDGTLGKVAYVEGLDKPATLNAGVFNVVIIDKNMENKYLFQYLKAPFLMDYVGKRATGGTIKHLNQNILVDFPVIHPSYEEQTKIGVFFSKLDDLIALHQRKLKMLQNMKKSCLEKMFV